MRNNALDIQDNANEEKPTDQRRVEYADDANAEDGEPHTETRHCKQRRN